MRHGIVRDKAELSSPSTLEPTSKLTRHLFPSTVFTTPRRRSDGWRDGGREKAVDQPDIRCIR